LGKETYIFLCGKNIGASYLRDPNFSSYYFRKFFIFGGYIVNSGGWIKIHRKITEWGWYKNPTTRIVFIHLLLVANHKNSTWHGIRILRGQRLTGRKALAEETGLSQQNIRTSLQCLRLTNEITIKSTNRYSIITVVNYDIYQSTNQPENQQLTSNQPATNQQLTTNKNVKNVKNVKKTVGTGVEEKPSTPRGPIEALKGDLEVEGLLNKISQPVQARWIKLYEDPPWIKSEILKALTYYDENPRKKSKTDRGWSSTVSGWLSRGWEWKRKKEPGLSKEKSVSDMDLGGGWEK